MIETCFCAIIICVILVMSKDPHRSLDIKSHCAKGKLSAISETIETSSYFITRKLALICDDIQSVILYFYANKGKSFNNFRKFTTTDPRIKIN